MTASAPLACPVCGRPLARDGDGRAWRCAEGHAFDAARQGYVNLLGDAVAAGDSAGMVAARQAFLGRGWFDPIARAIVGAAREAAREGLPPGAIVELGAGTAWYLGRVVEGVEDRVGVAIDSSVPAARRAARAHPGIQSVVGDVWGALPLTDASAALVLGVFAPRNGSETARVLAPGGAVLVVTPTPRHLEELRAPLGLLDVEPDKEERLARSMAPLTLSGSDGVEFPMALDAAAISELVAMGPTARHVSDEEMAERIATLDARVTTIASVTVHRFA